MLVLAGVVAMAVGGWLLVEVVMRITGIEETQTKLGLTLVGFATAFELVVLAWSTSRRGASEAAVAGVVGSLAYNMTMTLGAGALVHPLAIGDASLLRGPLLAMLGALALPILLALPSIWSRYYTARSRYMCRGKRSRSYREHTAGIFCDQQSN